MGRHVGEHRGVTRERLIVQLDRLLVRDEIGSIEHRRDLRPAVEEVGPNERDERAVGRRAEVEPSGGAEMEVLSPSSTRSSTRARVVVAVGLRGQQAMDRVNAPRQRPKRHPGTGSS